jgi:16S rRNA (guanine527-N7)-methyltransferase
MSGVSDIRVRWRSGSGVWFRGLGRIDRVVLSPPGYPQLSADLWSMWKTGFGLIDQKGPRARRMAVAHEPPAVAEKLFGSRLPQAEAYAEALATSGVERGLLGPREVSRIWDRHILNCVVAGELIPDGMHLADVGSGAGLPGLPLAIARPDLMVTLVEPLLRRVAWLEEVTEQLELTNVEVIRARANVVAESQRDFDVVTARAVAPLPTLIDWCLPLTRPDGEFLALKGESAAQELETSEHLLETLGAREWSVEFCGEGILELPTTVVRVVAGSHAQVRKPPKHPRRPRRPPVAKSRDVSRRRGGRSRG